MKVEELSRLFDEYVDSPAITSIVTLALLVAERSAAAGLSHGVYNFPPQTSDSDMSVIKLRLEREGLTVDLRSTANRDYAIISGWTPEGYPTYAF